MIDILTDPRFLALVTTSILFIVLGHRHQDKIQEPLKKEFIRTKYITVDWWSISHILFFAILGYIYPTRFWPILLIGIVWELFEDRLSKDADTKLVNCENKRARGPFVKWWCNGVQDDYWYGKADDILMNTIGFVIGSFLIKQKLKM